MQKRLETAALAAVLAFASRLGGATAAENGETEAGQATAAPDPSWQVDSTLTGQRYALEYPAAGVSTNGLQEDLQVALIKFDAPLRDDGAPYSLQPFLQHRSQWSLTLDGGHFATNKPSGGDDRTEWSGGITGDLNVYVKRWLALTGNVSYGFAVLHDVGVDTSSHAFSGSAGIGLRTSDTRLDLFYTLAAVEVGGSFAPLQQTFGASAFTVLARRASLEISGAVIAGGLNGAVSVEYFATRELGVFAGGFAAKGELYDDGQVDTQVVGKAGVTAWVDPTIAVVGEYDFTVEDDSVVTNGQPVASYHSVAHSLAIKVQTRFDHF